MYFSSELISVDIRYLFFLLRRVVGIGWSVRFENFYQTVVICVSSTMAFQS